MRNHKDPYYKEVGKTFYSALWDTARPYVVKPLHAIFGHVLIVELSAEIKIDDLKAYSVEISISFAEVDQVSPRGYKSQWKYIGFSGY